jgi:hypothetical protein
VLHNFLPLSWARRAVPPWYINYVNVIPLWYFVSLATVSSLIVLFFFWRESRAISPIQANRARHLAFLLILVLLAIVVLNGASAHLGGRVFRPISFCITWHVFAVNCLDNLRFGPGLLSAGVAAAILVFFVSTGVWGGIERQGL